MMMMKMYEETHGKIPFYFFSMHFIIPNLVRTMKDLCTSCFRLCVYL
jgi:hypothetical protein